MQATGEKTEQVQEQQQVDGLHQRTTGTRHAQQQQAKVKDDIDAAPATPPMAMPHAAEQRKLLAILHGKRIDDTQVRDAILRLKSEGHQLSVRVTWDEGDVDRFVEEALAMWDSQPFDTLVAGGGDGTLNELVAALLAHDAPRHISVAQLPLGTANDLASATGISLDPYAALALALDPSTARPIDVARVNGEVFTNLATAGPVSGVSSKEMSGTLKKLLGPAAVAVAGLRHLLVSGGLQPIKGVTITYPTSLDAPLHNPRPDQVAHLRGDLLVLAAGQARQMGRMVNLCPDALLDDGLLDLTLLFGSLGKQAAALASDIASQGLSDARGGLQLLRVPWCVVEAGEDLLCNRDGEPMEAGSSNRLVFEVLPRRIQMHLPDTRLLVEGQQSRLGQATQQEATPEDTPGGGKGHLRGWLRRRGLRTGRERRPRLLQDLWRAQQPPGRLSRLLPRLRRLLGSTVWAGGLLAVGFALGHSARTASASERL